MHYAITNLMLAQLMRKNITKWAEKSFERTRGDEVDKKDESFDKAALTLEIRKIERAKYTKEMEE